MNTDLTKRTLSRQPKKVFYFQRREIVFFLILNQSEIS